LGRKGFAKNEGVEGGEQKIECLCDEGEEKLLNDKKQEEQERWNQAEVNRKERRIIWNGVKTRIVTVVIA